MRCTVSLVERACAHVCTCAHVQRRPTVRPGVSCALHSLQLSIGFGIVQRCENTLCFICLPGLGTANNPQSPFPFPLWNLSAHLTHVLCRSLSWSSCCSNNMGSSCFWRDCNKCWLVPLHGDLAGRAVRATFWLDCRTWLCPLSNLSSVEWYGTECFIANRSSHAFCSQVLCQLIPLKGCAQCARILSRVNLRVCVCVQWPTTFGNAIGQQFEGTHTFQPTRTVQPSDIYSKPRTCVHPLGSSAYGKTGWELSGSVCPPLLMSHTHA